MYRHPIRAHEWRDGSVGIASGSPSRFLVWLSIALLAITSQAADLHAEDNPALPGFRADASDPRAIEIADEVMKALGGRQAWDNTRYVSWDFFERRQHWWDKWTGDVRIQSEDRIVLMNINTKKGRVWIDGVEVTADSTLQEALETGYAWWVNDGYWAFMPYKLKDSGVALKYLGEKETSEGRPADVLELTFEDVGLTPQNKYDVYVDKETHMVVEWAYYTNATDEEPRFVNPWANWTRVGKIMMVGDHGRDKDWKMRCYDELPRSVFESPERLDMPTSKTEAGGYHG